MGQIFRTGQISIYVIFGLVMVIFGIIAFSIMSRNNHETIIGQAEDMVFLEESLESYVSQCLSDKLKCGMLHPAIGLNRSLLDAYLETNVKSCFDAGRSYYVDNGIIIKETRPISKVTITDSSVLADLDYHIELSKGNTRSELNSFRKSVQRTRNTAFSSGSVVFSEYADARLFIPADVIALDSSGNPVQEVSISLVDAPKDDDRLASGLFYSLGPDGASFSPGLDFTISYSDILVNLKTIDENQLSIVRYEPEKDDYSIITTTVDTGKKTLSATLTGFSDYGIMYLPGCWSSEPIKTIYLDPYDDNGFYHFEDGNYGIKVKGKVDGKDLYDITIDGRDFLINKKTNNPLSPDESNAYEYVIDGNLDIRFYRSSIISHEMPLSCSDPVQDGRNIEDDQVCCDMLEEYIIGHKALLERRFDPEGVYEESDNSDWYTACCTYPTDCVGAGFDDGDTMIPNHQVGPAVCYPDGLAIAEFDDYPDGALGSPGYSVICDEGTWVDPDVDIKSCEIGNSYGWRWLKGGEIDAFGGTEDGESGYFSGDSIDCCGDDEDEYVICNGDNCLCCDKANDDLFCLGSDCRCIDDSSGSFPQEIFKTEKPDDYLTIEIYENMGCGLDVVDLAWTEKKCCCEICGGIYSCSYDLHCYFADECDPGLDRLECTDSIDYCCADYNTCGDCINSALGSEKCGWAVDFSGQERCKAGNECNGPFSADDYREWHWDSCYSQPECYTPACMLGNEQCSLDIYGCCPGLDCCTEWDIHSEQWVYTTCGVVEGGDCSSDDCCPDTRCVDNTCIPCDLAGDSCDSPDECCRRGMDCIDSTRYDAQVCCVPEEGYGCRHDDHCCNVGDYCSDEHCCPQGNIWDEYTDHCVESGIPDELDCSAQGYYCHAVYDGDYSCPSGYDSLSLYQEFLDCHGGVCCCQTPFEECSDSSLCCPDFDCISSSRYAVDLPRGEKRNRDVCCIDTGKYGCEDDSYCCDAEDHCDMDDDIDGKGHCCPLGLVWGGDSCEQEFDDCPYSCVSEDECSSGKGTLFEEYCCSGAGKVCCDLCGNGALDEGETCERGMLDPFSNGYGIHSDDPDHIYGLGCYWICEGSIAKGYYRCNDDCKDYTLVNNPTNSYYGACISECMDKNGFADDYSCKYYKPGQQGDCSDDQLCSAECQCVEEHVCQEGWVWDDSIDECIDIMKYCGDGYIFFPELEECDNFIFPLMDSFTCSDDQECNGLCKCVDKTTLPSSWDWRDVDGFNYMTSVKDQDGVGTCWAFANLGVLETQYKIDTKTDIDLSEQHLVSCNYDIPVYRFLSEHGIVEERFFSYKRTENEYYCPSFLDDEDFLWKTHLYNLYYNSESSFLDNPEEIDAIKRFLIERPLYASFEYFLGFDSNGHDVVLIGYDDDSEICMEEYGSPGCWIFKNSWGIEWGYDGYGYLPYDGIDGHSKIDGIRYIKELIPPPEKGCNMFSCGNGFHEDECGEVCDKSAEISYCEDGIYKKDCNYDCSGFGPIQLKDGKKVCYYHEIWCTEGSYECSGLVEGESCGVDGICNDRCQCVPNQGICDDNMKSPDEICDPGQQDPFSEGCGYHYDDPGHIYGSGCYRICEGPIVVGYYRCNDNCDGYDLEDEPTDAYIGECISTCMSKNGFTDDYTCQYYKPGQKGDCPDGQVCSSDCECRSKSEVCPGHGSDGSCPVSEEDCNNGIDDDYDGKTDCQDQECPDCLCDDQLTASDTCSGQNMCGMIECFGQEAKGICYQCDIVGSASADPDGIINILDTVLCTSNYGGCNHDSDCATRQCIIKCRTDDTAFGDCD